MGRPRTGWFQMLSAASTAPVQRVSVDRTALRELTDAAMKVKTVLLFWQYLVWYLTGRPADIVVGIISKP
ncbi:unnamed protein product [Protopolystoma xenopodis]|uniref:Uncharacterized protein n=1 Tax=Protopolystoma xenopodis TaxID=117903 RepID=A0A448WFC4_9PLAT|nr:unnamed protein product [Protopolystoma xenopodis]